MNFLLLLSSSSPLIAVRVLFLSSSICRWLGFPYRKNLDVFVCSRNFRRGRDRTLKIEVGIFIFPYFPLSWLSSLLLFWPRFPPKPVSIFVFFCRVFFLSLTVFSHPTSSLWVLLTSLFSRLFLCYLAVDLLHIIDRPEIYLSLIVTDYWALWQSYFVHTALTIVFSFIEV